MLHLPQPLLNLAYRVSDLKMWENFVHSTLGVILASITLGVIGTLGFAPYTMWPVTIATLTFEFYFLVTLKTKKHVFLSLLCYFGALNAATLEWLNFVMNGFGDLPIVLSWFIEIIFSLYLALFHAIFGTIAFKAAFKKVDPNNTLSARIRALAQKEHKEKAAASAAITTSDNASAFANTADTDTSASADAAGAADAPASSDKAANSDAKTANAAVKEQKGNEDDFDDEADYDPYYVDPALSRGLAATDSTVVSEETVQSNEDGTTKEVTYENRFFYNAYLLCLLPLALVCADFVIGWLFTGFPWMYVGYIAVDGPFSSYAPLLGVRGISLILFITAGSLALTLRRRYIYMPIAGMLFLLGLFMMGVPYTKDLNPIKVAAVQGNIEQSVKWNPMNTIPTIRRYVNVTRDLFGKYDLIVWPESALPVYVQQVRPLLMDLNRKSFVSSTPLMMGIQHITPEGHSYNSIFLYGQDEDFSKAQSYDKRKLVPFGEVVPFATITRALGKLFNFPMSSFSEGSADQKQFHLAGPDLNFVPAICYEAIFPELMLDLNNDKTNGIVMVSNDSWFGDTRGPYQHLNIARMRTLETQKPMIRVTNSGFTVYIDKEGKIAKELPADKFGVLEMEFVPSEGMTPYARFHDIPLIILLLLLIGGAFYLKTIDEDISARELEALVRP